jgi:hypothetical protein
VHTFRLFWSSFRCVDIRRDMKGILYYIKKARISDRSPAIEIVLYQRNRDRISLRRKRSQSSIWMHFQSYSCRFRTACVEV